MSIFDKLFIAIANPRTILIACRWQVWSKKNSSCSMQKKNIFRCDKVYNLLNDRIKCQFEFYNHTKNLHLVCWHQRDIFWKLVFSVWERCALALAFIALSSTRFYKYTQRSKAGSRQNECTFEMFLVRRTRFPCLQLYVKARSCWINIYPCKSKSIFLLLAIFQKEDQFKITWIHVSGTITFFCV